MELYDPVQANNPIPVPGAVNISQTPVLRWNPGTRATGDHTIFLGTDPENLPQVGTSSLGNERYAVSVPLDVNQVYYWRVDESSSVEVWTGKIWSFTTADHPIIDDMENYTDNRPDRIGETWSDRYTYVNLDQTVSRPGNGTGMSVGDLEPPYGPERDEDLVYSGLQSLPLTYDNRGVGSSLQGVYISETSRTFSPAQNWTVSSDGRALETLQLMLRGRYVSPCTYNYDDVNDQYTVIGAGTDIYGDRDEFHFAYQSMPLNGAGSISAKIESLEETDQYSKAGVMIRNGLEPDAQYAAVVSLPDGDIVFQYRTVSGTDANIVRPVNNPFTLPYWVKIKTDGTDFTAQMSADGQQWVDINEPVYISMVDFVYAGLAVSAHEESGLSCEAVFSNVDIQGTNPTLDESVDIGLLANDPANMYIRLKDATGATDTWEDPCGTDAVSTNEYRAVNIPLSEFDEIDLTRVAEMVIGIGDPSQAGGEGRVYVDDIALLHEGAVD
jgi:regulation of enolase protein 1 (concanavalin A-like superfamily)